MPGIEIPSVSPARAVQEGYTIVDVRSPSEFAEGHVPGAINLPLLNDSSRALVGLAYTKQGPQEARLLALDLVSPLLSTYLRHLKALAAGRPRLALMCWRGGERSRNVVLLLTLIGVHAVRVEGGYKAYRRWVLDWLAGWQPALPVLTLYGYTGSGKTAVLRALAELAPSLELRPAVLDLEGLALHRGSVLGGLNQPAKRTQRDFDARLMESLRRVEGDYLVLEGEGAKIGHLFLPDSVARAVRTGIPVQVAASVGERTRTILEEYAPRGWNDEDRESFSRGLRLITERLDGQLASKITQAFIDEDYAKAVADLLVGYYDPLYRRSSVEGKNFAFTLLRTGDVETDARRLAEGLAASAGAGWARPDLDVVAGCDDDQEVACSR